MGKTLIKVKCIDQRLFVSLAPVLASGGRNEDEIEFDFCPLWDGYEKSAVFYREKNKAYHAVIVDGRCVIPHEVLIDEGSMYFGVFGVKDDTTRTSEIMRYRVARGAITEGTNPSDPTPDIYAQYVSRIISLENRTSAVEAFTTPSSPYEITGNLVQIDNYEGMPMDCVTHIEPVQAGSGDPYPAGGGKNLIPSIADSKAVNGMTFTKNPDGSITMNGTATGYASVSSEAVSAAALRGKTVTLKGANAGDVAVTQIAFACDSGTVYKSCTQQNGAASYTFDVPADASTMRFEVYSVSGQVATNLIVYPQLELGSESTAYTPYSNIRPISGRTGAVLTRCGKNLCGGANDVIVQNNPSAATVTYADNVFTLFTADGYADGFIFGNGAMKKGKKYTISGKAAGYTNLRIYDKTDLGTPLYFITPVADGGFSHTFDAPSDDIVFRVWVNSNAECTLTDFQIEEGYRTEYEPYQGETFALDFGQTVYGGSIDWGKGLLTVDRAAITLNGSESWVNGYVSDGKNNRFELNLTDSGFGQAGTTSNSPVDEVICDAFAYHRTTSMPQVSKFRVAQTDNKIWLLFNPPQNIVPLENVSAWKVWLAANPITVVMPLIEPITIQLTPQHIAALNGLNYIWSDAGETTVSGRKDVLWMAGYLPTATAQTKGGVKIGKGLQMDGDVLSVHEGVYELISMIEINEPVARVTMNGFLLKEMLMTVYIPASDSNNVLAANIYPENGDGLYFSVANAQVTSGGRYTKVHCDVTGGLMRLQTGLPASKEGDTPAAGATGFLLVDGYIDTVRPYMGSSKDFPVGSWIKLEGVRANA